MFFEASSVIRQKAKVFKFNDSRIVTIVLIVLNASTTKHKTPTPFRKFQPLAHMCAVVGKSQDLRKMWPGWCAFVCASVGGGGEGDGGERWAKLPAVAHAQYCISASRLIQNADYRAGAVACPPSNSTCPSVLRVTSASSSSSFSSFFLHFPACARTPTAAAFRCSNPPSSSSSPTQPNFCLNGSATSETA